MKNKGYSKAELKARRRLKYLAVFVAIVIIITICFFVFVVLKNNIVKERIDYSSENVADDIVSNSTPIVINNVVLGASYKNTWVSSESYYFRNHNKITEVDVYNETGKKGKYKITNFTNPGSDGAFYVTIDNPNISDEFVAVGASKNDVMMQKVTKISNITDSDIEVVKKALGKYFVFNTSIKINSIHSVTFDNENRGRIICVTNEVGKSSGAYSAIIYESNYGKTEIIKYNYVKDLKKSDEWPIYSFKFVLDLNQDSVNELIIQETKEFEVKYDVIEFRGGKFTEVLSTVVKM